MKNLSPLLFVILLFSCKKDSTPETNQPSNVSPTTLDYRHEMRQFVIHLSQYARQTDADFLVIPQNGQQLAFSNGQPDGLLAIDYVATINGQGREELYYGFDNNDDLATPADERMNWLPYLQKLRDAGITILSTDYCTTPSFVDDSFIQNASENFLSFAADTRDLYSIPTYPSPIYHENDLQIHQLSEAQNFLYIINTQDFASKTDFINAVAATNYDVIIMDCFFEDEEYTPAEIQQIKQKANGGERLAISYMSIGEAEDYRYYWQPFWSFSPPEWMGALNPQWPGNFSVEYWNSEWQGIIYGNDESYVKKILNAGFDGAYLDIIDAFENFE